MASTTPKSTKRNKWIRRILIVLGVLIIVPILGIMIASEPLPEGTPGLEADALARSMMEATNHPAWENTGAVSWNFMGIHQHLWDRDRHFSEVKWDDKRVLINLNTQTGMAFEADQQLNGEEADKLVANAWEYHCNDAFWLNPISKLFDPGTSRKLVDLEDGKKGLLITYGSGGVTPGDSYLWIPGEDGLPERWKMWVNIIPVGGIGTTWEGWETLSTEAKISTRHKGPFGLELVLSDIQADTTLLALTGGKDVFEGLE